MACCLFAAAVIATIARVWRRATGRRDGSGVSQPPPVVRLPGATVAEVSGEVLDDTKVLAGTRG